MSKNHLLVKSMLISSFILFLYISGIFENAIGMFPECIGVCNNPGDLKSGYQVFLWLCLVMVVVACYNFFPENIPLKKYYIFIIIALLLATCLSVLWITSWQMDSDDRWITYRISKNVLDYGMYFWNPYEKISVATPVVWPFIASISHLLSDVLNIKWELSIKLCGVFVILLTGLYIMSIRNINISSKMFIFIGIISYFPLLFWSISGFETGFACLFIIYIIYRIYNSGFTLINWSIYCAIIFIRPEFIVAPLLSMFAYLLMNYGKYRVLRLIAPFFCWIIFVSTWLLFHKFIWNDYFPTPFYLKSIFHSPFTSELTRHFKITNAVVHYLSSILQSVFLTIGFLLFLTSFLIFIFRSTARNNFNDKQISLFIIYVGFFGVTLYHIVSGYMHMSYVFRYFVPGNIALIMLSGLLINEILEGQRWRFFNINFTRLMISITIIQVSIFTVSAFYVENVEMSLTRAKHRDAFSSHQYSMMMVEWRSMGEYLRSIQKDGDRLWIKDGTNIAGGAISNMYALDGYYTPLTKSKFKSIRECKEFECSKFFNYIMIRSDDPIWREFLSKKEFSVILKRTGVTLIRNDNPEF